MSDHLAGDSQRPVTGAGILVSRFLISGDRRHAVLLLLYPYAFREVDFSGVGVGDASFLCQRRE